MKKLILKNFQSPGDIVMLTAALRDLHLSNSGQFLTDVRTPCGPLWENSPWITALDEKDPEVEVIECDYPLIDQSNTGPWHFIHGFSQFLANRLGVKVTPTEFKGDIHISDVEKSWISQIAEIAGQELPFWIITAGGKTDFTIKWWDSERYQKVVDHFKGKVFFVQVGAKEHNHPALKGVLDLRGKTDLRQLVRLMYHAQGVLAPVTFLMHLAAAVETKVGMPKNRACVVIAGGREPSQWEAYPQHQFIHTNGALFCCDNGGCWKSRTVPIGDGDPKDNPENLCTDVVDKGAKIQDLTRRYLPKCMDIISAQTVIERIQMYYEGGALKYLTSDEKALVQKLV
ncbi:glycosyltransferase family 9 protein [Polynucleobacter paneuropaeus]|nr:glycosyltransferase family 9 protein [Polynucleobacter paneuropaeus]